MLWTYEWRRKRRNLVPWRIDISSPTGGKNGRGIVTSWSFWVSSQSFSDSLRWVILYWRIHGSIYYPTGTRDPMRRTETITGTLDRRPCLEKVWRSCRYSTLTGLRAPHHSEWIPYWGNRKDEQDKNCRQRQNVWRRDMLPRYCGWTVRPPPPLNISDIRCMAENRLQSLRNKLKRITWYEQHYRVAKNKHLMEEYACRF
jgi:hypothetical protein